MIEFRRNGRKVSQNDFFKGIAKDAVKNVISAYASELHGKASSVVDPDNGKHAAVFVRQIGDDKLSLHTNGTPSFARALEQRLGLNMGEVHEMSQPANQERLVYLAHASEDKEVVLPIAEGLMQRGIDVWYDNWEIGYGDSLRRKMDQGLGNCTHFVVLLTDYSINKPWVNEEIDAGLLRAIEGTSRFIGLRHNLPLEALPPLLRTRLAPELKLGDEGLEILAGEIYGVSRKPPLGKTPRYVHAHTMGSTWSASARVVAEYFVRNSIHGRPMDPQSDYEQIQSETNLPMPDVRIGVLDLVGAGLLEKREYVGGSNIWPKADIFVVFDKEFMDWNPQTDGEKLAIHLSNLDKSQASSSDVAHSLNWQPRRFNAAAAYLVSARIVKPIEYMGGGDYWPCGFFMGDELLRFVRGL